MSKQREIDPEASIRDVIIDLLRKTLPAELMGAASDLADRVADLVDVAPHVEKRWGQLSEREGNIIAREIGLIARDVIVAAGSTAQSPERLH